MSSTNRCLSKLHTLLQLLCGQIFHCAGAAALRSNDLPVPGYNLGGYPTLFFFPADDRLPRHISHAPGDYGTTRAGNPPPHTH